jgi:hypothetical protein
MVGTAGGSRDGMPIPEDGVPAGGASALAALPPADPKAHPRILLTRERIARIQSLAQAGSPLWAKVREACDELATEEYASGYEAWDWAHAAVYAGLCYRVTGINDFARAGLRYLRAMTDDHMKIGDGRGGDLAVRHDEGYPIRTRGMFSAIAYDWLHDAPGMTPEVRKHVLSRLSTWIDWYKDKGYNRNEPLANYYMGYFGTVAMTGIAFDGDDPRGAPIRARARAMWEKEIIPAFEKIRGGHWPEGWQYGSLVVTILSAYADAENRARGPGTKATDELPWLRETVPLLTHSILPNGKHLFPISDWGKKPADLPLNQFFALSLAFGANEPARSHALFLSQSKTDASEEGRWPWLELLAASATPAAGAAKAEDPRRGPTSYLAKGTGTFLARTDWSRQAVWVGMTSTQYIGDHQHLDQGHFEVVRGDDWLLVDPGDYDSPSTLSHNAIVVDDGKEHLTYTPNQGLWGKDARIARSDDDGTVAYAQAEYTSAYDNPSYPAEHPGRAVTQAVRELVFSRTQVAGARGASARLVIYDRFDVSSPKYAVTFLLHGGTTPRPNGNVAEVRVGQSIVRATTLLPVTFKPELRREPTKYGDSIWFGNEPIEGMTSVRLEIPSPKGARERRFLHAMTIGGVGDASPPASRFEGDDVDGALLDGEAYAFVRRAAHTQAGRIEYAVSSKASRHIIVGLAPRTPYRITVASQHRDGADSVCRVSLSPGNGKSTSAGGLLVLNLNECQAGR